MARTATAPERAAIGSTHNNIYAKLELTDPDGAWVNVSSGLGALDWLNAITLDDDVDANTLVLNATLLRDNGSTQSLAPLRTDSTLNRDALAAYAPFLDVARLWRVLVAVVEHGAAVVSGDWKEIGAGLYDVVEIDSPAPAIQLVGRDWGATLLDTWIEEKTTYGDDITPVPMEDVIQQMLDDNLGVGAITLYTPDSPLMELRARDQQPMSLMAAVNAVAQKAAMVCRYCYDASNVARLTLYAPDREAGPGDEVWELGPDEYVALPKAKLDVAGVRNRILIEYWDAATSASVTLPFENATSIARYGGPHDIPRTLAIDLSKDTDIVTAARVTVLGTAILSDLDTPPFEQQVEAPGFWIAQLGDYGKFLANNVHYDTDQYGGVSHITHAIANGTLRTTLNVRGQPAGRYRTWIAGGKTTGVTALAPTALITHVARNRRVETIQFDGTLGGVGPREWQYAIDNGAWSGWSAAALPVQLEVGRRSHSPKQVILQVRQADGQIATSAPYLVAPVSEGMLGTTARRVDEDVMRGGMGGLPVSGQRIPTDVIYSRGGVRPLLDTDLERVTTDLYGPTGTHGFTVIERGGGKGDASLDSGNVLNAGSADFSRAYTGKHLGNLPDDATSDRRAVTIDQRTGGGRAFSAIDSGISVVATAIDFARSFVGKHFGNIPDDATSDRRAVTLNQRTGAGRGFNAIDSGDSIVAAAIDFARSFVNKHMGNVPDDATSDRRAVTLNQRTGAGRGYNALSTNDKLATGVETGATAADGVAGIESGRGARKKATASAGAAAQGIVGEGDTRSGQGGVPVAAARFQTEPYFNSTGAVPLIDPVTKEILMDLAIGNGVRGHSTVAFGAAVKFPTARHTEQIAAIDTNSESFSVAYEAIPEVRVLPQNWELPGTSSTVARKIEFKAIDVTVSGFGVRAKMSTGSSSTARSHDFAATLNGSPVGGGISLTTTGSAAYCNLTNANGVSTTYRVFYDVDTSAMGVGKILYVKIYKNDGTSSTNWTEVASNQYDAGITVTGEVLEFIATMSANWDVRLVITYSGSQPPGNATVIADRVEYNEITAGTEASLTQNGDAALLVQALEAS